MRRAQAGAPKGAIPWGGESFHPIEILTPDRKRTKEGLIDSGVFRILKLAKTAPTFHAIAAQLSRYPARELQELFPAWREAGLIRYDGELQHKTKVELCEGVEA